MAANVRRLPPPGDTPLTDAASRTEIHLAAHSEPFLAAEATVEEIPALEGDQPLGITLNEAIRACLENDPVLRAGFEAIRQASADRLTASLKPNPEVDVLQSLLPLGRAFVADEREGGPPQLDVLVSYPIDWFLFGKRTAAMLAATRGVQVSESEYADLVRRRVSETAVAFVDVLEAQSLVDLARQKVERLQRVEAMTRAGVEQGDSADAELTRVRLGRYAGEQSLRTAERDLAIATAALRALTGAGHAGPAPAVRGTLDAPTSDNTLPKEYALALAEANRPDIVALRWQVVQARSEIDLQRREGYPAVSPQFIYSRQFQERAVGFPDVSSWGAGLVMEVPLHDRNQGNRARAASELSQAQHELRAALVSLQEEITALTAELEAAREIARAAAKQEELAQQMRDDIIRLYDAGGAGPDDLADVEREYFEARRNYVNWRADYWRAVYRLNAALGCQAVP